MSCESRHRELVATLLALAGITTPSAEEVIGVGIGRRHTRRGRRDYDDARPVQLDADIREALQIRGHADDSLPAWVGPLLDALLQAQGKGNRRALLTFLLLTGGWNAVAPNFTPLDIPWLRNVTSMNIPLPPVWDERLRVRPTTVGDQTLGVRERQYISVAGMLDAITGLDTVPSESARTVTPLQVMQVFWHRPVMSRLDLQRVLRAILEDAPGVSTLITQLREAGLYSDTTRAHCIPAILHGRAVGSTGRSLAQRAMDTLLDYAQHRGHIETGVAITPDVVGNPPPDALDKMVHHDYRAWVHDETTLVLPILFHWWRTHKRHDVCAQVSQCLVDMLAQHKRLDSYVCAAMITGAIAPPDGDQLLLRMDDTFSRLSDVWNALEAIATYITACQATGHLPVIDGLADRLQHAWGRQQNRVDGPTITPILAVGRERDLLLPALMAARSTERWVPMILDCIDAASMLDTVGGDSSGFLAVLNDALTAGAGPVDPRIIVRLAASPSGQWLLPFLSNGTTIPPWPVMGASSASHATDIALITYRIVLHLMSPHWDTAPDPLRAWWQETITQRDVQLPFWNFGRVPPLYPAIMPQVVIEHPFSSLIPHALAHPRWVTIPETTRRTVLYKAYTYSGGRAMIDLILRASTDAARQDVLAVAAMMYLSDAMMRVLRLLATPTG